MLQKQLPFLFLVALLTLSCQKQPKTDQKPPNIVWITSEDNSKHYLQLFDPNGVATPNIESLSQEGLTFTHAFSNAPVCSVARSTLITGSYAPRIGGQYHRKYTPAPMPEDLKMFPQYLREAGYHTSNNSKKDYNLVEGDSVWDESSRKASWKNREGNQPFFHMYNIGISHESGLHFRKKVMDSLPTKTPIDSNTVQPNHPNSPTFRYTNAYYRDKIVAMDKQVGKVLTQLKEDGLMDNTFVFYFGDHGGVLPGSKGYLYETGLHVPLVVHVPKNYRHLVADFKPGKVDGFVSFIDFGPTVLQLAGVSTPSAMDGHPFLGKGIAMEEVNSRNTAYSYSNRCDERYDMVRAMRKGKYKYIRNFEPFVPDGLWNNYRYHQLAYQDWKEQYQQGNLNTLQAAFFKPKPAEMLFDLEADPYETENLAKDPKYTSLLQDMRIELRVWLQGMPDLSFYPEYALLEQAFDNPTAFGQAHKKKIDHYLEVADLCLFPFGEVQEKLSESLTASDPWERYWALIAASSIGKEAAPLADQISTIARKDPEPINRVLAAEFLALAAGKNPVNSMTTALYESKSPAEALLILNAITLMASDLHGYAFDIDQEQLLQVIRKDKTVRWRLNYLAQSEKP